VGRTEAQQLERIYTRSAQIRRRRAALRAAAGAASLVLTVAVAVPLVWRSGARAPGPPVAHSRTTITEAPRASSQAAGTPTTACVCRATAPKAPASASGSRPRPTGPAGPGPQITAADRIAFATDRDGNWEVYTMAGDGTHLRRLTHDPAPDREPAWSPDGRRVIFMRLAHIEDLVGDIYVMDADGSHEHKIGFGGNPQWSPDGQKIAFHTYTMGSNGPFFGTLNVMNVDGTGVHQVATDAFDPSWTPDSRTLAFGGLNQEQITNVGTVGIDANGQKFFITHDPAYACQPTVSHDGKLIAYTALGHRTTRLASAFHLEVVDINGTTEPRELTGEIAGEWSPSWSPDQRIIAVERDPDGDPHYASIAGSVDAQGEPARIVLVSADGSGERTITTGPYNFADPAYAPRAP
jgi:Tol biopolymer transport system component